ncbi:uncharacterized protein JCM10292_005322 [Rhodotorula paludigena]|uniref:uncharacterized protein n=1 Tax=Rhodotorula paludigena TaxID=86838 RepID=UPI00317BD443
MGVSSLSSFVKKQNIGDVLLLPSPAEPAPIPAIVDGLAFAYHVGLVATFEGGGYLQIRHNVRRYIEYWRACGLDPEFVWDGPFDAEKLPTVISRSNQSLQRSIKYMRLPDTLRGQHQHASAATRLPPLAHMAIAAELALLGVPSHCAEEEADSPTAELAQRRNGFVISNDSDYFIYPAAYRGYVPLGSIGYGQFNQPRLEQVPPDQPASLHLRVYHPASIARALSLPAPFLPILAALVGNDLVNYSADLHVPRHSKPFPGHVDPRELLRISGALSTCVRMPVDTLAQVQDVVFAVLPLLLQRPAQDPLIVANLAGSAFAYALRPLEHPSPTFPLHARASDSPTQAVAREAYHRAYKAAHLSSFVLHTLKHGVVLVQGSVEMPEYQSPMVSLARPLRLWVYAILQESVGLKSGTVVEYVRRQDSLHAAEVPVLSLAQLLAAKGVEPPPTSPVVLAPFETRFDLFLAVFSLPPLSAPLNPTILAHLPLLLALRHIHLTHKRPFTAHEQRSALLVSSLLLLTPAALSSLPSPGGRGAPPKREHIQRSGELVQTLVGVNLVAQALLLDHPADAPAWIGADGVRAPHWCFDGRAFHSLLGMREVELERVVQGMPDEVRGQVLEMEAWTMQAL